MPSMDAQPYSVTRDKASTRPTPTVYVQSTQNDAAPAAGLDSMYQRPKHGIFPYIPISWVPYAELMRLDRLSGFWAFYWHYLIGLAYVANLCNSFAETTDLLKVEKASITQLFRRQSLLTLLGISKQPACAALTSTSAESAFSLGVYAIYLYVWTTVFRGITCTWNDTLDQDFDRKVARTRNRPIARGAVSTFQGHVFTLVLTLIGVGILYPMPRSVIFHALVDGVLLFVYPLLKRCTDFPQLELGFGLSYPVFIVTALMGQDPLAPLFELGICQISLIAVAQSSKFWSAASLYAAGILWTIIFDTIYAHQDYEDDRKAGVRGLAVRLGRKGTKPALSVLALLQVMLLIACGDFAGFGLIYRFITCGGVAMTLATMIWTVELEKGESCAWWFGPGSRPVGFMTVAGLLGEYAAGRSIFPDASSLVLKSPVMIGLGFVLVLSLLVLLQYFSPIDKRWTLKKKKWRLPPGPCGQVIVGNLFQMFEARDSGKFAQYLASMSSYGEMTTLHMGTKTWVLLNSERVAFEIISKRGKITTERPEMPIASGLVSNQKRTVIRQTKDWQEGRRVMHQLLSGSNLKTYAGMQELESNELLLAYLRHPKQWSSHHFRYATAVLYRVVMGHPLTKSKAELNDYQQVTMEFIQSINRSVIDFFPQLAKLPHILQPWRQYWSNMGAFHRQVFQSWWEPVKTAVDAGTAPPSFVRDVLLHPSTNYTGDNEEALYLATSIMAAGGDNTRMTLNTFIMALISHPAAQHRARAEVDRVCGAAPASRRLPRVADMAAMPYLSACVKEVLRWRPTVPVIPQHTLTEPLEFDGYRFPAGTDFLINALAIARGCERADEFVPERWIDGQGAEGNAIADFWGFGGGRRVCVGYKVAQQALFIAFARLVACFDVAPAGHLDDKVLNHGALDEPFPVRITIRSPEHEALILGVAGGGNSTYEDADGF